MPTIQLTAVDLTTEEQTPALVNWDNACYATTYQKDPSKSRRQIRHIDGSDLIVVEELKDIADRLKDAASI